MFIFIDSSKKSVVWLQNLSRAGCAMVLLALCLNYSFGQDLVTVSEKDDQHIFSFSEIDYLEDPDGSFSVNQVASPEFNLRFIENKNFNPINFNHQSFYWYRVKFKLPKTSDKRWVIEFFDQTIDEINFFIPASIGEFQKLTVGDRFVFDDRLTWHKNFLISLQPVTSEVETTCYFRIKSQQQADVLVVLRSMDWFMHYALDEYFFFGIFYGMILVFSLYNLLMFAAVREKHYLLYILYLLGIGFYEMTTDGLAYQYLWPNSPWWNQYSSGISLFIATSFSLFFTISILNLRKNHRVLFWMSIGAFAFRAVFFLMTLTIAREWYYFKGIELMPLGMSFYAAIRCLAKGYRAARFVAIGHGFLLFGIANKILLYYNINWMPYGSLSHYSLGFSFIMEMLFLSFAISDKIRLLRLEKDQAQEKIIEQMKDNEQLKDTLNMRLGKLVEEKTKQLLEKTEQVEHQNTKLAEANQQLARQAEEIAEMNALLARDNVQLKHDVAEVKEARILSKEVDFTEFSTIYPDDDSCLKFLADIKWGNGFLCSRCSHNNYSNGRSPHSRRCSRCGYEESVTTNTLLHNTKLPINKAFYMIFLVYSSNGSISSHKLSEILGIRQSTCWLYCSKIKKAMRELGRHGGLHPTEGWKALLITDKWMEQSI